MPVQLENINFIPDKIINERRTKRVKMIGTRVSLIFVVLFAISAGGIFYYNTKTYSKITKYKDDTKSTSDKINDLKKFGEEGFKLGARVEVIQHILNERPLGSTIISEARKRLPDTVEIMELSYSPLRGLSIKGRAISEYFPIDLYKENLLAESAEKIPSPFTQVTVKEAKYDKNSGLVEFILDIKVDNKRLTPTVEIVDSYGLETNGEQPEPTTE